MNRSKKIDLLKVSAADESRAIEAQLGEPEGEAAGALFPTDFAASGNVSIRFAEIRVDARS